jgi:tetratricopeptide (TPR) repeat protein
VLLAVLAASALPAARQVQTGQTFRTTADVVTIDVMVRSNGTPVGGLTAEDFVVLDNGVPQAIEAVELEAVPIDVSIVVDTGNDMAGQIEGLSEQVRKIAALARPTDRIRLMSAGTYVTDVVPAVVAAEAPAWPILTTDGTTSAFDGLAAALLRPVPSDRRHLVIAMMNGIDAISAIDAAAVRDIARRSGATLNIAQVDLHVEATPGRPPRIYSGRERRDSHRCQTAMLCQPTRDFWIPYDERRFEMLDEAARLTGGEVYFPSLFTVASASAIFRRVFEDYRRSYLLRYTPTGIAREGWHDVEVTLPSHPSYEVRARRGYAVDAGVGPDVAPSPARAPSPALALGPYSTLESIVATYDRGDYAGVFRALNQHPSLARLIREFRDAGNPWPADPRRESAFVIELAQAGLHRRAWQPARDLLLAHARLIRHPIEPDGFERRWFRAVLAVALNANVPAVSASLVEAALARFPGEPRYVLARAVIADQQRPQGLDLARPDERLTARTERYVEEVLALYDEAMRFDANRAEAAVRKAWVLYRARRYDDALALLDEASGAGPGDDAAVTYLAHLFRGRVLETLGRLPEARDAFRTALEHAPAAQSARVGLMTCLLRLGDHAGAAALADAIETAPADAFDPWWAYWSGEYRFYPEMITALREGAQ